MDTVRRAVRRALTLAAAATVLLGAGGQAGATGMAGMAGAGVAGANRAGYCGLTGMTVNAWTGGGDGTTWEDAANWSGGHAPGISVSDQNTAYVCIDAHGPVTMTDWAWVQAVDVAEGTTLNLATGSILFGLGDQSTRPSTFRAGSTIHNSGTIGGSGRFEVGGLLTWTSTLTGASTMVTRRCAMFAEGTTNACSGPVSGVPGTMRVLDTGVLDVNGNSVGVNLMDQYRLEVSGTLLLSGTAGYVAADRGTSLSLIPKASTGVGQLLIANDGGWYEGRTDYGQTTLSAIVNGGLIRKTAGTGTSVVIGTYSQVGAGAVRVDSGTLSMPDGLVTKVQVAAGRTYAKGACTTASYGCAPVATVADTQVASVTVPAGDPGGAALSIQEVNEASISGARGRPVWVRQSGLAATATAPAILKLRFDKSLVAGKTIATTEIWRRGEGTATYAKVPTCTAAGAPPAGPSCVDRRGLAGSSKKLADGDFLMVVRTRAFSRWVAR